MDNFPKQPGRSASLRGRQKGKRPFGTLKLFLMPLRGKETRTSLRSDFSQRRLWRRTVTRELTHPTGNAAILRDWEREHWRGASVDDRAGETATGRSDTSKALAMLSAFASVGAKVFDLSFTDLNRKKVPGMQRPGRSLEEMRRRIGRDLQDAERHRHNVIIRPRSTTVLLIQLDDIDDAKAERLQPYSFLTLRTSPGNGQVWLAVSDGPKESDEEAAREFKTRVRRGAAADQSATGATRMAGSLNFKPEYAPAFPCVEITRTNPGSMTTVAALELAGLIADREEPPKPPASVPRAKFSPLDRVVTGSRNWPDWNQLLRGARMKEDGSGPDRSRVDFMWCKWAIERGHSREETAVKLLEASPKARAEAENGDEGYARITAYNAEKAVMRERSRSPFVKSTAHPR